MSLKKRMDEVTMSFTVEQRAKPSAEAKAEWRDAVRTQRLGPPHGRIKTRCRTVVMERARELSSNWNSVSLELKAEDRTVLAPRESE